MEQYDRRHNDAVNQKLLDILDYFVAHKEEIISGMTGGVKLRELIAACFVFGMTIMGMVVYLLEDHASRPHPEATPISEFHRTMDKTNTHLARLESKIDRIIERGIK